MAGGHVEIERKLEPGTRFALPPLTSIPGVASSGATVEHRLSATYFDTADLRLARARITLRRRTGGTDAGWHLKLPTAGTARVEHHHPLGTRRAAPTRAVLEAVLGIVRTAPVSLVAQLETTRVLTPLLADDGRVLAEIADDSVTGTVPAPEPGEPATVTTWREIEVELVDGDEALLEAIVEALVSAGAAPSDSPSKLSRVLAARLTPPAAPVRRAPGKKHGKKRAGKAAKKAPPTALDVVVGALREQVSALQDADLRVRTGGDEGIHDLRVACRRLRSILAAFRAVLDREATDPLRDELQWVGSALSAARDGEVALAHLRELVAAQPVEHVRGPVVARLQTAAVSDADAGRRKAVRTLSDRRYLALLDALDALVADPPGTAAAGEPAAPALARAIRRSGERLAERVEVAHAEREAVVGEDSPLHDVRKAVKRVRYTAEVATGVLGKPARELIAGTKSAQEVLGDAQDTVATRDWCLRLGRAAGAAGESTWTWGRLHALEEARAGARAADFWVQEPGLRAAVDAAARR